MAAQRYRSKETVRNVDTKGSATMIEKYFEWNENAICALDRENAHSIPIIAMTVNAFDEDVRE